MTHLFVCHLPDLKKKTFHYVLYYLNSTTIDKLQSCLNPGRNLHNINIPVLFFFLQYIFNMYQKQFK